ncbi:MAG TPA: undecaprenyl-diphosphate phosphatase [Sporichthya sp.]|nr:undecaprenyl-diphosphate phosphatase [Sporichthya sp.]
MRRGRVLETWFQAVVLGLIQGLPEFLPISSSAHLRIFPDLFGWPDPGASFTAVIQIGTEVAVLVYFRNDIWRIIRTWTRSIFQPAYRSELDARLGWYVIIGTIPIGILGIVFEDQIKTGARNLWITGSMLIVFGLVLAGSERLGSFRRDTANLTVKDGVLGGLAQACALIPGVSRSGATIAMGLTLGQKRDTATRFAFLLAIPAVVAAGLFQLSDVANGESPYSNAQTALATLISFAVGYAAIAWLLRYVATHTYTPFVIYRVLLGATVLILIASGVLDAHTNITLE